MVRGAAALVDEAAGLVGEVEEAAVAVAVAKQVRSNNSSKTIVLMHKSSANAFWRWLCPR